MLCVKITDKIKPTDERKTKQTEGQKGRRTDRPNQ